MTVCGPRPFPYGSGPCRRPLGNLSHEPSETISSVLHARCNIRGKRVRNEELYTRLCASGELDGTRRQECYKRPSSGPRRSASSRRSTGRDWRRSTGPSGPYDLVAVAEAPDDESAFALELSMAGNVRTTAMRAYDREEMSGMVGAGSLSAGPGVEEPNDGVPDPVRQKPPRQNQ